MKVYKVTGILISVAAFCAAIVSYATVTYIDSLDDPRWVFVAECGNGVFEPAVSSKQDISDRVAKALPRAVNSTIVRDRCEIEYTETCAIIERGRIWLDFYTFQPDAWSSKRRCDSLDSCLKRLEATEKDKGACVFTLQKLPPKVEPEPRF